MRRQGVRKVVDEGTRDKCVCVWPKTTFAFSIGDYYNVSFISY